MWASGVCQRMVSDTIEGIRPGLARSLSYWSGFWFSARTEPVMVLRVVSLPPTISRTTFPRYSRGVHVPGGLAVGQHRDQVAGRRRVDPLVPQAR